MSPTGSGQPNFPIGRLVAMNVTAPGKPTEPKLITTASNAPAINCAAVRSTP